MLMIGKNQEALDFIDTIDAIGLFQHVTFPTHRHLHTLDLVLTDFTNKNLITKCNPGEFLSDHRSVIIESTMKKSKSKAEQRVQRKWKNLDINKFIEDSKINNISDDNLEVYWSELKQNFTEALDKQIPEYTKFKNNKDACPWYDEELKNHKKRLQSMEDKWRKHQTSECWETYKFYRRSYTSMLRHKKWEHLSKEIKLNKHDSKKIYDIVRSSTGGGKQNPMPPCDSEKELATKFSDYFSNKIETIRDNLKSEPLYAPRKRPVQTTTFIF